MKLKAGETVVLEGPRRLRVRLGHGSVLGINVGRDATLSLPGSRRFSFGALHPCRRELDPSPEEPPHRFEGPAFPPLWAELVGELVSSPRGG